MMLMPMTLPHFYEGDDEADIMFIFAILMAFDIALEQDVTRARRLAPRRRAVRPRRRRHAISLHPAAHHAHFARPLAAAAIA